MIIQNCPRCGGNRIRRGYRRTPWWWAMFGRYNLLCNSCNWEFVGFAVPGSVPEYVRKRSKQQAKSEQFSRLDSADYSNQVAETQELGETITSDEASDLSNQMFVVNRSDDEESALSRAKPFAETQEDQDSLTFTIVETEHLIESDLSESVQTINESSKESKRSKIISQQAVNSRAKNKKRTRIKKKK